MGGSASASGGDRLELSGLRGRAAFEIPVTSIADIIDRFERERRRTDPVNRIDSILSDLLGILEQQRDTLVKRQQEADGDLSASDLTRVREAARCARELEQFAREQHKVRRSAGAQRPTRDARPRASSLRESLERAHRATPNGHEQAAQPPPR